MAFDKCPHEEALAMLVTSRAQAIACNNGHILSGPIAPYGLAFDAGLTRIGRSEKGGIGGLPLDCKLWKKF
jgi:hypothetical protein